MQILSIVSQKLANQFLSLQVFAKKFSSLQIFANLIKIFIKNLQIFAIIMHYQPIIYKVNLQIFANIKLFMTRVVTRLNCVNQSSSD